MKYYTPRTLMLLCFICSILFFSSCNKDSDLFLDAVLLDPEEDQIENASGDGTEANDEVDQNSEEEESEAKEQQGDGSNLLLNGTFENSDGWELRNGSTATGGTLTVVANGNLGNDFPNWSAEYSNLLNDVYYETRRFRVTFDARQTSGSGKFQASQGFNVVFDQ